MCQVSLPEKVFFYVPELYYLIRLSFSGCISQARDWCSRRVNSDLLIESHREKEQTAGMVGGFFFIFFLLLYILARL